MPPFAKIILPAVLGIVLARVVDVPVGWAVGAAAVTILLTAINRRAIHLVFSVLLLFFAVATIMRPRAEIPQGRQIYMVAQVDEPPVTRGRWQATTAIVGHWREGSDWRRANERIQLYADTCYAFRVGDQIALRGWVNPVDSGPYGRLMALRGMHSRVYLTPGKLIRIAPHRSKTPAFLAGRLHEEAVERLTRLHLSSDAQGVVMAMVAGERRTLDRELRDEYGSTGTAHLLAVSGLHVGIVFVLVNIFLYFLPAVRRGNIYRSLIAILAIWTYAMAAGFSPSAVRAALMFSFAQLALASGSHRGGINIMLGAAVVMLALRPNWWGDPSFMLSYAAVLSIAAFFGPVYSRVRTQYRVVDAVISVILVGLAASVGTAPLVAYWFGDLPVAGMVLNPVVLLTAHVIVMFGAVWMVIPLEFWRPVFEWVLERAAVVQNAVVGWGAGRGWASVEVGEVSLWMVLVAYSGLAVLAIWLAKKDDARGY